MQDLILELRQSQGTPSPILLGPVIQSISSQLPLSRAWYIYWNSATRIGVVASMQAQKVIKGISPNTFPSVESFSGLVSVEWAPDGRTVVCFSEWGVCHFSSWSCQALSSLWSCVSLYGRLLPAQQPISSFQYTLIEVIALRVTNPSFLMKIRIRIQIRWSIFCSSRKTQIKGHPWCIRCFGILSIGQSSYLIFLADRVVS